MHSEVSKSMRKTKEENVQLEFKHLPLKKKSQIFVVLINT